MNLNKVQQVAKELIASDAKFIQSLFLMNRKGGEILIIILLCFHHI